MDKLIPPVFGPDPDEKLPDVSPETWHKLIEQEEAKRQCKPVYANEDGWTDWQKPIMRSYLLQCCNCNLIHSVDFRVVRVICVRGDDKTV